MSSLRKWAQNTQEKLTSNKNGKRKWIHPPEALQKGHIAYLVKFLGNTEVEEAKGIEVVKEAIRKLRFSQQLRKSETGAKTKKVELTISVDGVAIQEPRTHSILHQFPLHQISYCADDKGEKKFFSFIAKQQSSEGKSDDAHLCFVFISDKLAEDITLTIGQAFELAYKRFLDTSGKDLETQQKAVIIQQKVKQTELEATIYKRRLLDIAEIASIRAEIEAYLRRNNLQSLVDLEPIGSRINTPSNQNGGPSPMIETANIIDLNGSAPPVPPRLTDNSPAIGTKLEGLLLNEFETDNDFDPRSFENNTGNPPISLPLLAPPPKPAKRTNLLLHTQLEANPVLNNPLSGSPSAATPNSITSSKIDPFEMGDFGANVTMSQDIENAIDLLDKKILEMKAGFTRGISFGNDDFSLESLDPLNNQH
ncbi:PTB domain-containing engulfment adapter protein 1 [Dendroctonus ponderosae]|uniref:PID domain-containing protein n=2 Tax=Dendroctonus ponderosae TaxID=77166 RepID=A0AAR5Q6R6_DENPD|nr:PTB domain-containing engulfment adapter protein 1 [Dendroctonus ponderosae]